MMKKNQNVYALGIASILVLAIVGYASTTGNFIQPASATTSLKYPSLHLVNEQGQFIDMKLMGYKQSDGQLKKFIADDWFVKDTTTPTFAIKMEDVFKLRADQGKGFKAIDTTATGLNVIKGMNVVIRDGSNDDWDHFITYQTTSSFDSAYKNTYFLNQHNPCWSEESFQFVAGSRNVVQVYATVYFADSNTWAEYVAQVVVIGANASDNPTTGCDTNGQAWSSTIGGFGSIFTQQQQQSVVIINNNEVHTGSGSSSNSHHSSSNSNSNDHHDSHHNDQQHDNHDHRDHNHDSHDQHPRFLPGNKNLHEDQTEYDPTDTNSGTGPHVEDSSKNNSDNTEQQHHDSTNTNSDSSQSHDNHHEDSNNNKDSSDNNNNDKSGDNTN